MKDFSRKPYLSKSYRDMMDKTPNAQMWSQVIEAQSEFEKPYLHAPGDYQVMQYLHPPAPSISFDVPDFDFSFDVYNPAETPVQDMYRKPIWDIYSSASIIVPGESGYVNIKYGWYPFTWEISGKGFTLERSKTWDRCNIVHVADDAEGYATITVTDHYYKNQAIGYVFDGAELLWDNVNSVKVLGISDSGTVYITGGTAPYDWVLAHEYGQGFAITDAQTLAGDLDNVVTSDATAYGRTLITVTDAALTEVTGRVHGNWREDWEGSPENSVHVWEDWGKTWLDTSFVDYSIVDVGGAYGKVLSYELYLDEQNIWNSYNSLVFENSELEIPLNLGNYSGFACEAYLANFTPTTFTSDDCPTGACTDASSWHMAVWVWIEFGWRVVGGGSNYNYSLYGLSTGARCRTNYDSEEEVWNCSYETSERESFATFITRLANWNSLQNLLQGDPVLWGNGNYELTDIALGLYLSNYAYDDFGAMNMKAYFSDIVLTPV